ncbi:MAG: hypothetical protein ACREJC_09720 [Tepidisphaeraceae bacterium]
MDHQFFTLHDWFATESGMVSNALHIRSMMASSVALGLSERAATIINDAINSHAISSMVFDPTALAATSISAFALSHLS